MVIETLENEHCVGQPASLNNDNLESDSCITFHELASFAPAG